MLLAAHAGACNAARPSNVGYDLVREPDREPVVAEKPKHRVPPDVVQRARGPVRFKRLSDGSDVPEAQVATELLKADVVCAGEEHTRAAQHYGELWLFERLAERAPALGLELGVGFEMWASDYQRPLWDYQRGKIDQTTLLQRTQYEERWGYPFAYYSPILERARRLRLPLVALNARAEITSKIAEGGVDALSPRQARSLPALDLDDAQHRADFERRMKDHPGVTEQTLDRYYQAQVVWDESMAHTAARWVLEHAPMRRLLVLAGQAHCQERAIPNRVERRGVRRVTNVLLAEGEPSPERRRGYEYALIVGQSEEAGDESESASESESEQNEGADPKSAPGE
ncbi:MAG TPA: ChaN family lipoprotein [Polyangiaceae bacterium]|nr:ChaN family lipoprotein [Polyangiaceae bacterium]